MLWFHCQYFGQVCGKTGEMLACMWQSPIFLFTAYWSCLWEDMFECWRSLHSFTKCCSWSKLWWPCCGLRAAYCPSIAHLLPTYGHLNFSYSIYLVVLTSLQYPYGHLVINTVFASSAKHRFSGHVIFGHWVWAKSFPCNPPPPLLSMEYTYIPATALKERGVSQQGATVAT